MAALKKKDDDMRAMEERYKMYLEKARDVSHGPILAFSIIFRKHYVGHNRPSPLLRLLGRR